MIIKTIKIKHLRNITKADLFFSPEINIVTGDNGAGKTTLLEAIYLLARAKSFRQGHQNAPIQKGNNQLFLFAETENQQRITQKIGLTKKGAETQIRIDGSATHKLSELARSLPISLITPQSHRILEDGPQYRRKLLNWGMFHVEHEYKAIMSDFKRTLLQRNNALKNRSSDLPVWSSTFVEQANAVSIKQESYMEQWKIELLDLCKGISFLEGLDLSYYRGWSKGESLENTINTKIDLDRERGFTSAGPHRADLIFKLYGKNVNQSLSRGQQKVLIAIVLLAQARVLEKESCEKPIFLFDDFDSELDRKSTEILKSLMIREKKQSIITSLLPEKLDNRAWPTNTAMFHVEHGCFS